MTGLLSAPFALTAVPEPVLVKDIRPESSLNPQFIRTSASLSLTGAAGTKTLLTLSDPEHGEELWITDGTPNNLTLLKDIRPGPADSAITALVASGNRVFFLADDDTHGQEIWVTDGTTAGTRLVADLVNARGLGGNVRSIQPFQNGIMFVAESDLQATALWFSDGTGAGTRCVKPLVPGGGDAPDRFEATGWLQAGSQFYFVLQPSETAYELWKTNGTPAGTSRVITLPRFSTLPVPQPVLIGALGQNLLFQSTRKDGLFNLMRTNGTAQGTQAITQLRQPAEPDQIAVNGNRAYFLLRPDYSTARAWVTDGTGKGTRALGSGPAQVSQLPNETLGKLRLIGPNLITPVFHGGGWFESGAIHTVTGEYNPLFSVTGSAADIAVTQTDGVVSRVFLGISDSTSSDMAHYKVLATDGTPLGTRALSDISYFGGLASRGSSVVFAQRFSHDAPSALVNFVSPDTSTTIAALPAASLPASASPQDLRISGNELIFTADDGTHGREFWKSDGTGAGTVPLENPRPADSPLTLTGPVLFQGRTLFLRPSTPHRALMHLYLLEADGSKTMLSLLDRPGHFTATSTRLFFSATGTDGVEPWVCETDNGGQSFGIRQLANLKPGSASSNPAQFTEMNGWVYFTADSAISSRTGVLWRVSNAPGSLPEEVPSYSPLGSSTFPDGIQELVVRPPTPGAPFPAESLLYFTNRDSTGLYQCRNGQASEFKRSGNGGPIQNLQVHDGTLFFNAITPGPTPTASVFRDHGDSDAALTPSYNCHLFTVVGQTVYYQAHSSAGDQYLECVQKNGTGRVRLLSHLYDPLIRRLHVEGDNLFFIRRASASGRWTVWMTRGTPESTFEIPGSERRGFEVIEDNAQVLADRLYFNAIDPQAGYELHALPLNNWLTVTDVTEVANPVAMTENATLDLGPAGVPRVLRFTNDGPRALPALSLTGLSSAPFTADVTAIPSLAPGASAEVTISFSAFNAGTYSAEMRIFLEGVNHHTHTHRLLLKGRKVGPAEQPGFSLQPRSFLTFPGGIVTFRAAAFNHSSALWFKDYNPYQGAGSGGSQGGGGGGAGFGGPADDGPTAPPDNYPYIPPAETAVGSGLALQRNANADDAGVYTLLLGAIASQKAVLAVVQPAPENILAVLGKPFWINCTVTPGILSSMLTYQWFRNGVPLSDVDRRRGSRSSKLELDALQLRDAALYSCEVTLHAPDGDHVLNHGITRLIVLNDPAPSLPENGLSHFVGQPVSYQLTADQPVDRFTVKGLPPGLKAQSDGLITGIPTKAQPVDPATGQPRPYLVTVTATNASGTGPAATLRWTIHSPLPAGTYEGLLGRIEAPGITQNLGSRVKLTFTPAGALTGTLLHRGRTYRFAGGTGLTVGVVSHVAGSLIRIDIPQFNQLPPFQLFISVSEVRSGLTLDTRDGNGATGFLQKQVTPQRGAEIYCHPLYTIPLTPPENAASLGLPSGNGFLTATVSQKGNVTWKGKLADGTAVTGSGLWTGDLANAALPLHVDLYQATGSLHGWITFSPRLLLDSGTLSPSFLGGVLNWSKAAQPENSKDRVYKNGFAAHDLFLQGREYQAPAKGQVIMGLATTGENARVYLTGPNVPHNLGGLNGDRILPISITPAHRPLNFSDIASPRPLKNLTLSPATGTYKGTLLFPHEDPKLNRTATFEGVILSPSGPAPGFFLLSDLPAEDQPASALKTAPIQSGPIEIQPPSTGEP